MQELSERERALSNSDYYQSFIKRRSRLSWSIFVCSIGLVLVFNLLTKFSPALANSPLFGQGAMSIGIVFAFLTIVINVIAAIYFVYWNNREHSRLRKVISTEYLQDEGH